MTEVVPCRSGKDSYDTEDDAKDALGRVQAAASRKARRKERRVYLCGYCDQWHLSSQRWTPAKGRRKI